MLTHKVARISPMLAVADLPETVAFYTELLGFTALSTSAEYVIIERNSVTLHLVKAADQSVLDAVRGHAQIYIEVVDIQSLWDHVQNWRGKYKMRDLGDREYGMTEFHLIDPNDCLIFVGQPTASITRR